MTRQAWLTPDDEPEGTVCITLEIPSGEEWEQIIRGALALLFDYWNFEQSGSLTPEETAATFMTFMDQWMTWETGEC